MATSGTRRRDLLHPQRMAALAAAALPRAASEIESLPEELIRAGRPAMACLFEIILSNRDRSRIMTVHPGPGSDPGAGGPDDRLSGRQRDQPL